MLCLLENIQSIVACIYMLYDASVAVACHGILTEAACLSMSIFCLSERQCKHVRRTTPAAHELHLLKAAERRLLCLSWDLLLVHLSQCPSTSQDAVTQRCNVGVYDTAKSGIWQRLSLRLLLHTIPCAARHCDISLWCLLGEQCTFVVHFQVLSCCFGDMRKEEETRLTSLYFKSRWEVFNR